MDDWTILTQEAIDYTRKLRPGSIETEEQEAAIYDYERTKQLTKQRGY